MSIIASFNDEVTKVLDKTPRNATYTSPTTQKQILQVLATKVKSAIRDEIGDAKFCIIVDEARDESKKEQMSIVLRFVDRDGFIQERFFGVVHVKDTIASTLKECIFSILSRHNLDVQNIRGQGYDGASNMRGEWNGLKALILVKCPYAYYVHYFAHRLQLALVASSKEVIPVHHFFTKLNSIINVVGASCKRNDQLKVAYASNIAHLLSINELESGRGLNQIGSLQRPDETTPTHRGDADAPYEVMTSFEFVFIMHLMRKVLEISNILCQALQLQSQDILNAMHLVTSTKLLIQKLRDSGWDELVSSVKSFFENVNITVPDFDAQYIVRRGRARHQQDELTIGHHYKVDIFNAVIDSQLQELNNRFDDKAMELIILSSSLDPKEMRISFRIDDICKLVEKFYPQDFADYEILQLRV
nr:zinc finger MYM-type protein 1-like [Ipomoea batatas]